MLLNGIKIVSSRRANTPVHVMPKSTPTTISGTHPSLAMAKARAPVMLEDLEVVTHSRGQFVLEDVRIAPFPALN